VSFRWSSFASNLARAVAKGDRLFPLVFGSGNRAREYWGRQTHSLVAGTEHCFDWWLRVDAQFPTSVGIYVFAVGIYVFAVATISAIDRNLVSGCRFVKSSMGLRALLRRYRKGRLCFILRLVIGSRFSPLCLSS
jgi:hypothetical protein